MDTLIEKYLSMSGLVKINFLRAAMEGRIEADKKFFKYAFENISLDENPLYGVLRIIVEELILEYFRDREHPPYYFREILNAFLESNNIVQIFEESSPWFFIYLCPLHCLPGIENELNKEDNSIGTSHIKALNKRFLLNDLAGPEEELPLYISEVGLLKGGDVGTNFIKNYYMERLKNGFDGSHIDYIKKLIFEGAIK